jgi:superfamily II DNA or RNA helicase
MEVILSPLKEILKRKPDAKIAIIVHKNDHVVKVREHIVTELPDLEVGMFCGLVPPKEKRAELSKQIIVTTDQSFKKGMDVPDLEVLVNIVPFSSAIAVTQIIGRLRRIEGKRCWYFDITDEGVQACKDSRARRKKVLLALAKKTLEMKF